MLLLLGYRPPTDAMFTMRPEPCLRRCGANALASRVRAPQIGVHDAIPDVSSQRREIGERDADVPRGVVDQDVHAPKPADDRLDGGVDRDRVALVELDGQ